MSSAVAISASLASAPARPRWMVVCKRALDVVLSLVALIVTLPVMLLALLAIVAVDPGNPIFRQERVGRGGKPFMMFKLRTMVGGAHDLLPHLRAYNEVDGPVFKMRADPRLHALGGILRRTSIDELPNFINVLIGNMSIVGPRPPLPEEVAHYDAYALRRLSVKPGITCLWQVSGRSNTTYAERVQLDERYVKEWSLRLDARILLKTVKVLLKADGAY